MSQTDEIAQEIARGDGTLDIVVVRVREPWHERLSRWLLDGLGEATAAVLGLAFVLFGFAAMAVGRGEADVAAFVPNVEEAFARAFAGRDAEIGGLVIRSDPAEDRLSVSGDDIVVSGEEGPLAELAMLEADLDYSDALRGRASLKGIIADGLVASIVRREGGWVAGLGQPSTLGQLGPVVPIGGEGNGLPRPEVDLRNATLYILDESQGLDLVAKRVRLRADAEGHVALSGQVGGGELSARMRPNGDVHAVVERLQLAEIAPETGLGARLKRSSIPVTGSIHLDAERAVTFDLVSADAGDLKIAGSILSVSRLALDGIADVSSRRADFDLVLESDKVATRGRVGLELDREIVADLKLGATRVEVPALPAERLVMKRFVSRVRVDPVGRRISLSSMDMALEDVGFAGGMGFELGETRLQGLQANLAMSGELSPERLLSFWPEGFVGGARRWIERAVLDGAIRNIVLDADLPASVLQGGEVMIDGELNQRPTPEDALLLTFDVDRGRVRYISTMTPLENARGSGVLRGNSFDFDVRGGGVGGLEVLSAQVRMPRLVPKGGPLDITVQGRGEVPAMLRLIDEEPFRFASAYGLDPDGFTGVGEVELQITRPLREFIAPEQVSYAVNGTFRGASVPFSLFGQPLTEGEVSLVADKAKLEMKGPVSFGPWRAELVYSDTLGDFGAAPTRASLEGALSRDALDAFGIGLRSYFDGDVPVRVDALTDGLNLRSAEVVADLTDVGVTVDPYWDKPKGIASELSLSARREGETTFADDITMTAPGMRLDGSAAFRTNGQLERFKVDRLSIRDVMDIDLLVTPNADRSRLDVTAGGEFLDLSPAVERRLRNPAQASGLPVDLEARFGTLKLAEGYEIAGADVMFASGGNGIERARLAGEIDGTTAVAAITPSDEGRELNISVPDASGAAQALFGWRGIAGGEMQLSASLPPVGEPGAAYGDVRIDDITLTRAPILAQLLSLASLTGLGDTLSGQGLNFEKVRGEFAYRDGVVSLRDTRASGPALGLTVEGEVGLGARELDLNGVLVPAYRANSLLGGVPLIGDLLVGDKGEGIVSLGYTVGGPYTAAQVAVNPVSVLTPGVLRDVFEPQRDDIEEIVSEGATATDVAEIEAEVVDEVLDDSEGDAP